MTLELILKKHVAWLYGNPEGEKAILTDADLTGADLHGADLHCADLTGADLHGADLHCADLHCATLTDADLTGADLTGANLYCAQLKGTVLDPSLEPNGRAEAFLRVGDLCIGYRTRRAGHIDQYRDGRIYAADWFSVCKTECHPGLYLWPTPGEAIAWAQHEEIICVETNAADIHQAGSKWRCRWFRVRPFPDR